MNLSSFTLRAVALALLASCQGMHVAFLKFGSADRKEALIAEVRKVQELQYETEEDFVATMGLFRQLVEADAEQLEKLYGDLRDGVDDCQGDVEALEKRVASVESLATKLFEEWRAELELFTHPDVRVKSETMLEDTVERYARLREALLRSQQALEPVQAAFQDYVLFFNHNLNPRAIATLEDTYPRFIEDVTKLKGLVEEAVVETDEFVRMVEGRSTPSDTPEAQG